MAVFKLTYEFIKDGKLSPRKSSTALVGRKDQLFIFEQIEKDIAQRFGYDVVRITKIEIQYLEKENKEFKGE